MLLRYVLLKGVGGVDPMSMRATVRVYGLFKGNYDEASSSIIRLPCCFCGVGGWLAMKKHHYESVGFLSIAS